MHPFCNLQSRAQTVTVCDLTFRRREEREENNYFAKFDRKKNEMI
jgi:hypothetical protein